MREHNPPCTWRQRPKLALRLAVAGTGLAFGLAAPAQVLFNETFTGGASTAGFTVAQAAGTCTWTYDNPGGRDISGAGFDTDFAIFDSDACGSSADSSAADLASPVFDASAPGSYILSFDQQYREVAPTVANVQVWNGTEWTVVYSVDGSNVGYPNPAVTQTINITDATGGSTSAQVRFHFGGDWRWWWALDNISLEVAACAAPGGLAVTAITTDGGTIGWTDNGSAGYEWAVTTGDTPDGTNEAASGDGSNLTITGLSSGAPYTAFVRADCGDGTFSSWSSGFPFTTAIANDECSGAIALTVNPDQNCTSTTPGTVAGATDSGTSGTCGGTPNDDVWFSFEATSAQQVISLSNITGSTTDMYMALWTGDCDNLTQVPGACSDPETMAVGGLTIGATYYLQVYTWTSNTGQTSAFDVCVGTPPPPPANDECSGAFPLTVNPDLDCASTTAGTVYSATGSGITSTCGGTPNDDVWFSFEASSAQQVISLSNITGSTTDMYMALWTGDCDNLTQVPGACSDPETMAVGGLTIGATYYLQVYTYTSITGQTSAFDVCVGTPPPPPANDECSGAFALTVNENFNCTNTTPGTVLSATPSGVTSTCGGTADDDVWYSFVATHDMHRISLENITGSTSDMYMALWTGDCDSLTLVPGSCSDPQTMDIEGLTPGTTYYLQVYTWTSSTGQTSAFDVCVGSEPFCQPPMEITVASIGAPDASVTFQENTAGEYQYELRESGAPGSGSTGLIDSGSVPGSPIALTGIVADVPYTLYIRSICSPGDTSSWSSGLELYDGYCPFTVTNAVEPICNVTFADINNDSDPGVDQSPALEDFTNLTAHVVRGQSVPISVTGNTAGNFTTYITAFFDWDNDHVFEAAVPIGSFTNTVCDAPATGTITVPSDASIGASRMRVVKNFNTSPTDPCGSYGYGQAEDYALDIGTAGVPEIGSFGMLAVHPNPASTELFITPAGSQPMQVQVYDMVGHLAMEQASTGRLDISKLAPGSYTLSITDLGGAKVAHARFVKQ